MATLTMRPTTSVCFVSVCMYNIADHSNPTDGSSYEDICWSCRTAKLLSQQYKGEQAGIDTSFYL